MHENMLRIWHWFMAPDPPCPASQQNKSVLPSPDKDNKATALNVACVETAKMIKEQFRSLHQ